MKYVFITGMGRSGTKFLASLLSPIEGVQAEHEFIGNREFWLLSWYLPHDVYAEIYLQKIKKEVEKKTNQKLFIDVNSMLQNCVPTLNKVFTPTKIFHLVRDPRDVVRSLYTRRNEKNIHLVPKTREDMGKWMDGDKFYQICWNWKSTTEKLLSEKTELIRFEDIISDYKIFNNKILEPLQLEMTESQWSNVASKKVNETKSKFYRKVYSILKGRDFIEEELPRFDEWSEKQKKILYDICGDVMKKCRYKFNFEA